MIQQFHIWAYIHNSWKRVLKKYLHNHIHCRVIHNSQKVEATQMSIGWWRINKLWYMHTAEYHSVLWRKEGTSLAVQWLRLCSTAGGEVSLPGWGTKIPHVTCVALHCHHHAPPQKKTKPKPKPNQPIKTLASDLSSSKETHPSLGRGVGWSAYLGPGVALLSFNPSSMEAWPSSLNFSMSVSLSVKYI